MVDSGNGAGMRERLIKTICETYGVVPEEYNGMVMFRARNGRIFASIDGNTLDTICGREAIHELRRPYQSPSDKHSTSWASVVLDELVRFNVVCKIVDVAYVYVTSREPIEVRDRKAKDEYREISARIAAGSPAKTYRDVSLVDHADTDGIPERILVMRNLLSPEELRRMSESYIFLHQAKFMEDYEDDYEYTGKRGGLYQTYRMMSNNQLRGYFGWRTAYRAGKELRGSTEYPFILACELINGVGWTDPKDGLKKLVDLLWAYPQENFPYRLTWVLDFCAVYDVQGMVPPLSTSDMASHTLECPYESTAEEALATTIALSKYKISMSKIMNTNETDVAQVLLRVFRILHDKMADSTRTLFDMGFSQMVMPIPNMFNTANYYDPGRGEYTYRLPGVVTYHCVGRTWTKTMCRTSMSASAWFGEIARSVDSFLRARLGIKGTLKPGTAPGTVEDLAVRAAVDQWMEERSRVSVREVEIDTSLLGSIRRDADEIRDKIITEEERETVSVPASAVEEEAEEPAFVATQVEEVAPVELDELESAFVALLLAGQPYRELLGKNRLTADVLADRVNETLFDTFGDTVIDMSTGKPVIIEDYREDLEGIING